MLSHCASCSAEARHVCDGLGRETLELLVGVAQDLDHRLQSAQVGDRASDLQILRDVLQDLQRSDLQWKLLSYKYNIIILHDVKDFIQELLTFKQFSYRSYLNIGLNLNIRKLTIEHQVKTMGKHFSFKYLYKRSSLCLKNL